MTLEDSKVAIPVISAIVERDTASGKEILIQTRIAKYDKLYQGTIEIPAGRIEAFENVKETIIREIKDGKLRPAEGETKDLRWMKLAELQDIIKNSPNRIFALQLPVLDFYLKQQMR